MCWWASGTERRRPRYEATVLWAACMAHVAVHLSEQITWHGKEAPRYSRLDHRPLLSSGYCADIGSKPVFNTESFGGPEADGLSREGSQPDPSKDRSA